MHKELKIGEDINTNNQLEKEINETILSKGKKRQKLDCIKGK